MSFSHVQKTIPLAALAALALVPAAASGSSSQVTIMQDDTQLVAASADHRAATLDEMKRLGADIVKVRFDWASIAPSGKKKPSGFNGADPNAYPADHWAAYDDLIRGIVQRGMRPYIMLGGRAPDWASGHSPVDRPSPTEFGRFAEAVGKRYSGSFGTAASGTGGLLPINPLGSAPAADPLPRVTLYSDWNEPNLLSWLAPQYKHGRLFAPRVYRKLVYAAYDGLSRAGHGSDEFLIGELLPFAREGRTGHSKIRPIAFLREMACVDSHYHAYKGKTAKKHGCDKFRRIPATALAYHPYTLAGGPDVATPNHDDASIGELSRVTRALDRLTHAHRFAASGSMRLWITEFGFQTDPPDHFQSPIKKVPGFMGESEWLAYRNPRVISYSQYPLVDDKVGSGGAGFQSGLRTSKGKKKKGVYNAFRAPLFVQERSSKVVEVFGGVRAGAEGDKVTVQQRSSSRGKWRTLGTVTLGTQGYFDRIFSLSSAVKRQYRFRYSGGSSRAASVHR